MSFYYDIFKRGAGEGGGFFFNQGWKPYVKRVGLFGSKGSYRDETSEKLNRFQVNQNNLKNRVQDASSAAFVESQRKWTAGTFQDARQEYVEQAAESVVRLRSESAEALNEAVGSTRPVASTSEAAAAYNRRREGFAQARRNLREAQARAESGKGSNISYRKVGIEMMDTSMDKFYQDFDNMIDKRRQEYATKYGVDSYSDLDEGYFSSLDDLQGGGFIDVQFGIGQLGIDTLVLGDILGQSSSDLTFLASGGMDNFDIREILESTRENYAQLGQQTAEGINEAAMAEDEGRRRTAEAMRNEALKGQAKIGAATEESIAQQMKDLSAAERASEEKFQQQTDALTGGAKSRKKRVRGVSFTDTRPQ